MVDKQCELMSFVLSRSGRSLHIFSFPSSSTAISLKVTMADNRPFIVIVPGASQNPAHYGYLSHLLFLAGYPVFTALLPSIGAADEVSVQDDAEYIRHKMIIPVLDHEERDVVLVMHSYSSAPGSAAARGLGKGEREAQGKKTAVIGQIYLAALLAKGGDEKDIVGTFGGNYPPHIRPDVSTPLHFASGSTWKQMEN
jgi:hypothetical protein